MNCQEIRELLPDLAAGMNAATLMPEAAEHIASCADCATHVRELQNTMALLDEWQAPEPSPYFDTRMQARLREEMARPQAASLRWLSRTPHPTQPAQRCGLRSRHFLAQARLHARIEIGRRLGRLPFIEQGHGVLQLAHMGGTIGAGCDVFSGLRHQCCSVHASGQVRQQFANFLAIHTAFLYFPETNFFSCSRSAS